MPSVVTAPRQEKSDDAPRHALDGLSGDELERLMEGYQKADRDSTTELVRRMNPRLFRYFRSHAGSTVEAEDLLQEAWLRIHRARHTYRRGLPVLPWLYAIAEHTRIDSYRKHARRIRTEIAVDPVPEPAVAAEPGAGARIGIEELLARLPDGQREVLLLLKLSGMSLEEVARLKGCTVGAVKLKAHRAYEALRSVFSGKGEAR